MKAGLQGVKSLKCYTAHESSFVNAIDEVAFFMKKMYPLKVYLANKIIMDIFEVKLSSKAKSDLKKIPVHIVFKLQVWVDGVRKYGLREMKKRAGLHDEPLKGGRKKATFYQAKQSLPCFLYYR